VEVVGGDLSWHGLLRCRGGGPREAAEDEGLLVLLGDRSAWTKGSTGAHNGVARRGRGVNGEKGEEFGSTHGKGEKKRAGGFSGLAPHGGGEHGGGGAGGR
jgi:hypothetical protein